MTIRDTQLAVHCNAREKGWWPDQPSTSNVLEKLCLVHSEVSEAVEEVRRTTVDELDAVRVINGKPEGFGVELADAVIRIFDLAAALNIDLESLIEFKAKYNESRPHRHGGKLA